MYTLQNDMLTQIMAKHIRQRKYIDIFRLGVGCIIVFGEACVEEWARVFALDRAACGCRGFMGTGYRHPGSVVFVVLGLFA